ncbi:hypothetical protein AKJ65_00310 [candidate division MSBL1 archaeon SCGC-AAA259E19]|uniref:Uncharacterized protein n=1 Tax=candidate division MSBL1 archaeon SCGC-AAA259E19 TaxID=1698264 RepID=A0A133UNT1_9EURY|nr:hypothetical protein AKJ65_00310 [candidate division MSBL1 archaeon SCGC-AAA259E19]
MMDPIWLIPTAACVPVAIKKAVDAKKYLNREEHLTIMGIYAGSAYFLYGLVYWLGTGISRRLTGEAWISGNAVPIHTVISVSFAACFGFLVHLARKEVKTVGPPEIERMREAINKAVRGYEKAGKHYRETNNRIDRVKDNTQEKYKEVENDVEERYERVNERIDALDGVVNDHEESMKDNAEKMRRIGDQMEKQAEAVKDLKDEVESLRGKKGEEEGHEWEDEVAQRFEKFGYGVEINPDKGPDIVVRDSPSGQPLFVVGAKAYKLKSRRGLSDKFSPEVDRAKTAEAPLVVAVKNKLNDLELFNIFKPGELENFTCSAPTWLVGEEATDEGKEKERECRRALKDLLLRSSVE